MDAKTAKTTGQKLTPGKSPKKVFLLEDEPILLKLMEEELRHHNIDVWSFCCPAELKENCSLEDLSDQVVVTDEHMPGMNGLEFISELEQVLGPKKPVCILFTGNSDSIEDKPGHEATNLVVEKPVDPEEFMAILHGMLGDSSPEK